jgi:hypothetical protein
MKEQFFAYCSSCSSNGFAFWFRFVGLDLFIEPYKSSVYLQMCNQRPGFISAWM